MVSNRYRSRWQKVEVQGCDFYTFRAGEVVRKDSYWKLVEGN